jgi:hypothetical protein
MKGTSKERLCVPSIFLEQKLRKTGELMREGRRKKESEERAMWGERELTLDGNVVPKGLSLLRSLVVALEVVLKVHHRHHLNHKQRREVGVLFLLVEEERLVQEGRIHSSLLLSLLLLEEKDKGW